MHNIPDSLRTKRNVSLCRYLADLLRTLHHQGGVVAEFSQVLQSLEDVGLARTSLSAGLNRFRDRGLCLRLSVLIVQSLLKVGQLAVIVLDDLGRQV